MILVYDSVIPIQGVKGEKGAKGDKGGPGVDGNIFRIKAQTAEAVPPEYYVWIEIINTVLETTNFGAKGESGPQVSWSSS